MVEPGEGEVIDPLSAVGAKAAQAAVDEVSKAAGNILTRMFGPPADVIGDFLGRKMEYRLNNAERIAEKAQRRAKKVGRENGSVAPRLAYTMLEEGTYSDNELMAEYLGGVLASGRTPSGTDDRGVTWTKLLTSMSSMQIRAHFIFYREWASALRGGNNPKVDLDPNVATMYVDLLALVNLLLEGHPDVTPGSVVDHAIGGLARLNLIGSSWMAAPVAHLSTPMPELPFTEFARVRPTHAGMELYGWACGQPGFGFTEFMAIQEDIEFDTPIARPGVMLPHLLAP